MDLNARATKGNGEGHIDRPFLRRQCRGSCDWTYCIGCAFLKMVQKVWRNLQACSLLRSIWMVMGVPQHWKDAIVKILHKKKDWAECGNCRSLCDTRRQGPPRKNRPLYGRLLRGEGRTCRKHSAAFLHSVRLSTRRSSFVDCRSFEGQGRSPPTCAKSPFRRHTTPSIVTLCGPCCAVLCAAQDALSNPPLPRWYGVCVLMGDGEWRVLEVVQRGARSPPVVRAPITTSQHVFRGRAHSGPATF